MRIENKLNTVQTNFHSYYGQILIFTYKKLLLLLLQMLKIINLIEKKFSCSEKSIIYFSNVPGIEKRFQEFRK